jgi:hypothetical protein
LFQVMKMKRQMLRFGSISRIIQTRMIELICFFQNILL